MNSHVLECVVDFLPSVWFLRKLSTSRQETWGAFGSAFVESIILVEVIFLKVVNVS